MEQSGNIQLFVKSVFHFTLRVILFTGGGLIFNWVYGLVILAPVIRQWGVNSAKMGATSGFEGFFLSLAANWYFIVILLFIFAIFPFLWFMMGKSFGVTRALRDLFLHKKDQFLNSLYKIFVKIFEKTKITGDRADKKSFREMINREHLPYWYKVLIYFILDQIELGEIEELLEQKPDLASEEFQVSLVQILEKSIMENYLSGPWVWFFLLLAGNIASMVFLVAAVAPA